MVGRNSNKGFTLIELLLALAIMGIVMTAAGNIIVFGNKSYNTADAQLQIQQQANIAVVKISNKVRSANSITFDPASPKVVTIDNTRIEQDPANPSNLIMLANDGTKNIIAESIKTVSFSYDNGILTVSLTTENPKYDITYDVSTKLYSRANSAAASSVNTAYNDFEEIFAQNVLTLIGPDLDTTFQTGLTDNGGNILICSKSVNFTGNNAMNINMNKGPNYANTAVLTDSFTSSTNLNFGNGSLLLDYFSTPSFPNSQSNVQNCSGVYDSDTSHYSLYSSRIFNISDYAVKDVSGNYKNHWGASTPDKMLDPININRLRTFSLRMVKSGITNLNDLTAGTSILSSSVHYFDTTVSQPNLNGNTINAADFKAGGPYDYIICHGPLIIGGINVNDQNFNFRGLIYCDDVIQINNLNATFTGIIIGKNMTTSGLGKNTELTYDNYNSLPDITKLVENSTTSN